MTLEEAIAFCEEAEEREYYDEEQIEFAEKHGEIAALLKHFVCDKDEEYSKGYFAGVKDATPDWITEVTPHNKRMVLVTSTLKNKEKRVRLAYYENGCWHGGGKSKPNVTAWQDLPIPYEEEDEEKR